MYFLSGLRQNVFAGQGEVCLVIKERIVFSGHGPIFGDLCISIDIRRCPLDSVSIKL